MGLFWFWRQKSQIGLLGEPSYSRHVLLGTLLGVCWGVHAIFTLKIRREMVIFQARTKKSVCCLCQFRLFFFQLTFTGGNPWPILVPTNPFGRKSGVFFCLQIEKVLCLLTLFSYTCTEFFFFLRLPSMKVSSFLDKTVCRHTGVPQRAFCYRKVAFFYFFCGWSWDVLFSIHLKLLKWSNFETIWIWTSKCTFKIVWCYHCFNRLTWYSGAC